MLGDPASILLPFLVLVVLVLAVLGLGAPGKPEVLVPLVGAPPADAFIDNGTIEMLARAPATRWALRAGFAAARAMAFGLIVAVALRRARAAIPDLREAAALVRSRFRTLAALAVLSSAFALLLLERSGLDSAREAGVAGTALLVGTLFAPGAFLAAAGDGLPLGRALRRGGAWVGRRPLGHVGLVLLYVATLNGLLRLATFGEPATPRAFPLTLYAFVTAFATQVFATVLARRYVLLYATDAIGDAVRRRRVRRVVVAVVRRLAAFGAPSRAARREVIAESRADRRARRAGARAARTVRISPAPEAEPAPPERAAEAQDPRIVRPSEGSPSARPLAERHAPVPHRRSGSPPSRSRSGRGSRAGKTL